MQHLQGRRLEEARALGLHERAGRGLEFSWEGKPAELTPEQRAVLGRHLRDGGLEACEPGWYEFDGL